MRRGRGLVLAMVLVALLGAQPAQAQDTPPLPTLPQSAEIDLKLQRDGSLSVAEAVSVPDGPGMTRRIPLRIPDAGNRDRVFAVRDISVEGDGNAELRDDALTVRLGGGSTSIVRYTVDGAVADSGGRLEVSWELEGGWDAQLNLVRAGFAAPKISESIRCTVGPPDRDCQAAQINHVGLTRFSQQDLRPGERIQIDVELPAGTVPANARLAPSKTLAGAFVLTAPVAWAWAGFAALLVAGGLLVWRARRRDAVVEPLPLDTDVLPGHIGMLLAGRVDGIDVAATVVDLVVRGHLQVTDSRLSRRNPPDEQLTRFERLVLDQSEAGSFDVSAAIADDVVRRGWFRRPGRLRRAGVRAIFYGAFLTVLLSLTVGYAQFGVILATAGAALALGAPLLPARTKRGQTVRRQLYDLDERLRQGSDSERDLPFAVALGRGRAWTAGAHGLSLSGEFIVALTGALTARQSDA